MRVHARSMRMHTTSLRTQAYVCARILLPRNPNLSFLLLFLYFFHVICLSIFTLSYVFESLSLCLLFVFSSYVRFGFPFNVFFILP